MPGRITQVLRLRITIRESVAFLEERAGLGAIIARSRTHAPLLA